MFAPELGPQPTSWSLLSLVLTIRGDIYAFDRILPAGLHLEAFNMLLCIPLLDVFWLRWLYEEYWSGLSTLELRLDKWNTPAESTTSWPADGKLISLSLVCKLIPDMCGHPKNRLDDSLVFGLVLFCHDANSRLLTELPRPERQSSFKLTDIMLRLLFSSIAVCLMPSFL